MLRFLMLKIAPRENCVFATCTGKIVPAPRNIYLPVVLYFLTGNKTSSVLHVQLAYQLIIFVQHKSRASKSRTHTKVVNIQICPIERERERAFRLNNFHKINDSKHMLMYIKTYGNIEFKFSSLQRAPYGLDVSFLDCSSYRSLFFFFRFCHSVNSI